MSMSGTLITRVPFSTVVYLAKDQLSKLPCKGPVTFVIGATRFCVQALTDTSHMICGTRSIRHYAIWGGGQNCLNMHKKRKNMTANSKDYCFPISTELLRPFSTRCRQLGRKRPEKWSVCWISGCALICDHVIDRASVKIKIKSTKCHAFV